MLFILGKQYCATSVSCCYYLDAIFKLQLADNWSSSNKEDIPQTSWSSCDIIIYSSSGNHDNIP